MAFPKTSHPQSQPVIQVQKVFSLFLFRQICKDISFRLISSAITQQSLLKLSILSFVTFTFPLNSCFFTSYNQYLKFSLMKTLILLCLCTITTLQTAIIKPISLALSIYSNGFAIVKDVRKIFFDEGQSQLQFSDFSSNFQRQTINFRSFDPNIKVYQQQFVNSRMNWIVFSQVSQLSDCEITYRTRGFSWTVDYTLQLNDDKTADFIAWVILNNNSGKRYQNTSVKLIIDGYSFRLNRRITLRQSGQKKVQLFPSISSIPVQKNYQLYLSTGGYAEGNLKTKGFIKIVNKKQNKLGQFIPNGIVRIFQKDKGDGSLQFIGQDRTESVPDQRNLQITQGFIYDITAEKTVLSRNEWKNKFNTTDFNSTCSVKITNSKTSPANVTIKFSNKYGDNLSFGTKSLSVVPEKVSINEYKVTKLMAANEVWQFNWFENYAASS